MSKVRVDRIATGDDQFEVAVQSVVTALGLIGDIGDLSRFVTSYATVAEIEALSLDVDDVVFYLQDPDLRGFFKSDLSDTTTPSDGVDTLVTSNGTRIKRSSPFRIDSDGNAYGLGIKIEENANTNITIDASMNGKVIWLTATTAITVTMPDYATDAIPGGFSCIFIQGDTGVATFVGEGADAIVSASDPIVSAAVGAGVTINKKDNTTWWAVAGGVNPEVVKKIGTVAALKASTDFDDGDVVFLVDDGDGGSSNYTIETSATAEDLPRVIVLSNGQRAVVAPNSVSTTDAIFDAVKNSDFGVFAPSITEADDIVVAWVMQYAMQTPVDWAGSVARLLTPSPTGVVFDIKVDGASVGTITFAASSATGTFSTIAATPISSGSVLTIETGGTVPSDFSDFTSTIRLERTA